MRIIIPWQKTNKIYILFFFFILIKGLIWTWSIPPFLAPDELPHFAYTQYLVEEKEIPKNTGEVVPLLTTMSEEAEKAAKLLQDRHMIASLGHMNFSDTYEPIPKEFKTYARKSVKENYKNSAAIYSPFYYALEAIPYIMGYNLNIFSRFYLMRAFSLIFLFITIVFVYKTALLVSGEASFALTAAAIVALMPSINSSSFGGINNDAALIAFGQIMFYSLFKALKNINLKITSVIGNGALLGLTLLTKPQAVIFIPLITGVFSYKGFKEKKWRQTVIALFVLFFIAFIIAAPFYIDVIKNFITGPGATINQPQNILSLNSLITAIGFDIFRRIFLLLVFWTQTQLFNSLYPSYVNSFIFGIELASFIGLIYFAKDYYSSKINQSNKIIYNCAALCATSIIALEIFYTVLYYRDALSVPPYYNFALQGRYYFLVIGPLITLLLLGLRHFFHKLKIPKNALYIGLLLSFLFLHNYALINIVLQYNYL